MKIRFPLFKKILLVSLFFVMFSESTLATRFSEEFVTKGVRQLTPLENISRVGGAESRFVWRSWNLDQIRLFGKVSVLTLVGDFFTDENQRILNRLSVQKDLFPSKNQPVNPRQELIESHKLEATQQMLLSHASFADCSIAVLAEMGHSRDSEKEMENMILSFNFPYNFIFMHLPKELRSNLPSFAFFNRGTSIVSSEIQTSTFNRPGHDLLLPEIMRTALGASSSIDLPQLKENKSGDGSYRYTEFNANKMSGKIVPVTNEGSELWKIMFERPCGTYRVMFCDRQ